MPTPSRTKTRLWDILCTVLLGTVLAFSGAAQFLKMSDALHHGDRLLALYQVLIAISSTLMAVMVVIRRPPVEKGGGWSPKAIAAVGSFAPLPLAALSLTWQPNWLLATSSAVMIVSYVWIIWALLTLRRSFSVFAEARKLVTSGPYGLVRHPLYAAYFVTYACTVIPRIGVWALLIGVVGISAEVIRSREEEKVLSSAFPEYEVYARTTRAFVPSARGVLKPRGAAPMQAATAATRQ